ncbi:MAG TPA: hypothetical protein VH856_01470, partial [Steroidobacteraceae bacterium]
GGGRQPAQGESVKIGCPKEIKVHEYRVGLVPAGVRELASAGHEVMVETGDSRTIDRRRPPCARRAARARAGSRLPTSS